MQRVICARSLSLAVVIEHVLSSSTFLSQGVKDVVRDVFLPWYNAYRFLVQQVCRRPSQTSRNLSDE
jgi:hypothetical protein